MSISNAQFLAWLAKDNQNRVLLVEAQAYVTGTGLVTRYMATKPFVSAPTDSPASQAYDDLVANVPAFTRKMAEQFVGQSIASWGDIDVKNDAGARDSWLNDGWDGRAVNIYLGDTGWNKADFRLILAGYAADLVLKDWRTLTIKARDKQWCLTLPLQTNTIGGTTANQQKPIPICYGQCQNVSPLLVDNATNKYQVHDGAIQAINQVYQDGVAVGYTASIATGTFTLSSAATGQITADVQGAKPAGTYLTKIADIIKDICTTRTILTAPDIDVAGTFTAMNTTAPQTVGLYVDQATTVMAVLDQLVKSVGGWFGFSRAGLMQIGQLQAPAGTPVVSLAADDIKEFGISIKKRQLPSAQVLLGYAENYTVQAPGLNTGVTQTQRAVLADQYQAITAANAGVLTKYLLADRPTAIEGTLIVGSADATTEATRRINLYNAVRSIYTIDCFAAPFQVDIGSIVSITFPRFGWDSGVLGVVVGFVEQPTSNRLTLDIWL